jgi:hypothetical protein
MVTVLITCCDRLDLLKITLNSFLKFNTYPVEFIARDDSGLESVWNQTKDLLGRSGIDNLLPRGQVGQLESINLMLEQVKTPYLFHLEEDWEFYQSGFIERGLELIKNADQVRFRDHDPNLKGKWTGDVMELENHKFSFNPHLRRTIKRYEGNETSLGEQIGRSLWVKGYCRHLGANKPTNRFGTPYFSGVKKA